MAAITPAVREFLAEGPLAHVVTLNADGTPHVSLAWVGLEHDELVFGTFTDQNKLENLRRDPRVVVSFQANHHTGEGLWPYLVIRGRARVTDGPCLPLMDRLAETYIGPGAKFPMREVPDGFITRVTVDSTYGIGPWRDPSTG